ncbi:MAG TPA: pyridoxamine 5'-phosphate oxidase family protein [Candidatus Limnocylindrales bacterium]|jgi:PPOX class probable F420-dependent enzyme
MESARSATSLPARIRDFLTQENRFATVATTDPDGAARQAVTWFSVDDDDSIWLNSRWGRRWPANVQRDPRVSLAVIDLDEPERWVGLRGEVVETVDDVERARADIVAMAHRYHPEGPDPDDIAGYLTQPRVMFRVAIHRVHDHLD